MYSIHIRDKDNKLTLVNEIELLWAIQMKLPNRQQVWESRVHIGVFEDMQSEKRQLSVM